MLRHEGDVRREDCFRVALWAVDDSAGLWAEEEAEGFAGGGEPCSDAVSNCARRSQRDGGGD